MADARLPRARLLGRGALTLLVLNVVVGGGVVALPGRAYAAAGMNAFIGLLAAAALAGVIGAAFARLAARYEGVGGPYLYALLTLGPRVGAVVGWLMIGTRLAATAASLRICSELVVATARWSPGSLAAVRVGIWATLAALALRDVTTPVRVANAVGSLKLGLLAAIAIAGCIAVAPHALPAPTISLARGGLATATLIWFYAFSGFESPTILAADANRPRRDLPFALLVGIGTATLLYAALLVSCVALVPGLAAQSQPLLIAANILFHPAHRLLPLLLVVITGASLPSQFVIAPRLLAGMATRSAAPALFAARDDEVSQPAVGIYALSVVVLSMLDLTPLIAISALIRLGSYAMCAFGLVHTARRQRAATDLALGLAALNGSVMLILLAVSR